VDYIFDQSPMPLKTSQGTKLNVKSQTSDHFPAINMVDKDVCLRRKIYFIFDWFKLYVFEIFEPPKMLGIKNFSMSAIKGKFKQFYSTESKRNLKNSDFFSGCLGKNVALSLTNINVENFS
jgi:hypothetical protein